MFHPVRWALAALAALALAVPVLLQAQEFPGRPIALIERLGLLAK